MRQGSPGELMVESTPSGQRRPLCKTNKEESDEAADVAALTYLLTRGDVWRQKASLVLKLTRPSGLIPVRLQIYTDVMLLVVFCTLGPVTPLVSLSTSMGICCP